MENETNYEYAINNSNLTFAQKKQLDKAVKLIVDKVPIHLLDELLYGIMEKAGRKADIALNMPVSEICKAELVNKIQDSNTNKRLIIKVVQLHTN